MKKATIVFVCHQCRRVDFGSCTISKEWGLYGESLRISPDAVRIPDILKNKGCSCLSPEMSTHPKWELENVYNSDFTQKEIKEFKAQCKKVLS